MWSSLKLYHHHIEERFLAPCFNHLSFGGGDDLLVWVLVQDYRGGLLCGLLGPWTSVQKPGPALQGGSCWDKEKQSDEINLLLEHKFSVGFVQDDLVEPNFDRQSI